MKSNPVWRRSLKSKHRPKADLIREALDRYIAEEHRLPRWIGMIKDDDGSLRSDRIWTSG